MTEETNEGQQQQAPEPPPAPAASSEENVRKHELFIKLTRKLADAENRLASVHDAAKAAEEARLAEQGEFKALAEQRAAELAATKAAHEQDLLRRDADLALVTAGLSHPALRKGYIADYIAASAEERIPLADWARSIREAPENAPLFDAPGSPPVGAGPAGGAAARSGGGRVNPADLFSKDEATASAAWKAAIDAEKIKLGRQ